ncbi:hypothetical protein O6H91_05G082900 [Diphasiastrum complanatum]|uniref:Uncharacterized protein n=2 Tax=Diphasiastrum complanatum TaxID=34168 RepID=A0ACC2DQ96_DIPCM|nr:hypothetical protein O6H91_05G082600 [Diphasiastrum complanatum]KAJ7556425.1 hypothetical protein O6H91_05G082900 [Diphasiastrum complanatum]
MPLLKPQSQFLSRSSLAFRKPFVRSTFGLSSGLSYSFVAFHWNQNFVICCSLPRQGSQAGSVRQDYDMVGRRSFFFQILTASGPQTGIEVFFRDGLAVQVF